MPDALAAGQPDPIATGAPKRGLKEFRTLRAAKREKRVAQDDARHQARRMEQGMQREALLARSHA